MVAVNLNVSREEINDGVAKAVALDGTAEEINETLASVADKQDTLVSGTNIKTINNESILGSGNIEIKSGTDLAGSNSISRCVLEAPNGVATYSGSVITIKRGLTVLIPDGFNSDGTVKSIKYTLSNDITHTETANSTTYPYCIFVTSTGSVFSFGNQNVLYVKQLSDRPTIGTDVYKMVFVRNENKWYVTRNGSSYEEQKCCYIGRYYQGSGHAIQSLYMERPINLLSISDKHEMCSWSFPSSRIANLTLGAHGSKYTAPGNGWFYLTKTAGKVDGYISMQNLSCGHLRMQEVANVSYAGISVYVPAKKGDIIDVCYDATGEVSYFGFIYAEGEEV